MMTIATACQYMYLGRKKLGILEKDVFRFLSILVYKENGAQYNSMTV